ncbi:MAG: hypothetical protein C4526_10330 [Nitrospiraceae bacterium]|nr:MAG: hypothetical protein C4526_10330 [Nitrospiraceae bacterium]
MSHEKETQEKPDCYSRFYERYKSDKCLVCSLKDMCQNETIENQRETTIKAFEQSEQLKRKRKRWEKVETIIMSSSMVVFVLIVFGIIGIVGYSTIKFLPSLISSKSSPPPVEYAAKAGKTELQGEQIDFDNISDQLEIKNKRFFFLRPPFFTLDDFNPSPLIETEDIPIGYVEATSGSLGPVADMVIQKIPTKSNGMHFIEGKGIFYHNFLNGIYSLLPRIPILAKILYRILALLEVVFDLVYEITDANPHKDQFSLLVDNSLNNDIYFYLDNHQPVKLSARRQIHFIFKAEDIRLIKISNATNSEVIESFKVDTNRRCWARAIEGIACVYNVRANNEYKIINIKENK